MRVRVLWEKLNTPQLLLWSWGIPREHLLLWTRQSTNIYQSEFTSWMTQASHSFKEQWTAEPADDPTPMSHRGLCRSRTAWSLQKVKPHRSCCRCWRIPFQRPAARSRTWPCWCRGWTRRTPGHTPCRWLSAARHPRRCDLDEEDREGSWWAKLYNNTAARCSVLDLPIFEFGHHHDGAKGLLFGQEHVVLHVGEQCGLHEKTWGNIFIKMINWC